MATTRRFSIHARTLEAARAQLREICTKIQVRIEDTPEVTSAVQVDTGVWHYMFLAKIVDPNPELQGGVRGD